MPFQQPQWKTQTTVRLALSLLVGAAAAAVAVPVPVLPSAAAPPATATVAAPVPVPVSVSVPVGPARLVWERTNRERAAKNLAPLALDPLLTLAAQAHARDMLANHYFDHTDRQGGEPADRAQRAGYQSLFLGENIAWGQDDAAEVMDAWMHSDGHRGNILDPNYRAVGIGIAGKYWVQVFGDTVSPGSAPPVLPPSSSPNVSDAPRLAAPATVLVRVADFEGKDYKGWTLSGNCWGTGPETLAFAGTALTGWTGNAFATTAHRRAAGAETTSGTGAAISDPFVIPGDAVRLRFRIAGGRYPNRCCLNLLIDDRLVRTATGESLYRLQETEWDIADLRHRTARLEIRDDVAVGANAFIHVDDIALVCEPLPPQIPPQKAVPRPLNSKRDNRKAHKTPKRPL